MKPICSRILTDALFPEGTPSLVCDFQELYRHLIDDFVIEYSKSIRADNFVLKDKITLLIEKEKGRYLNERINKDLLNSLDRFFERKVALSRIRRGAHQEIETLINEEALLLAKYLRNEKQAWIPRIASQDY